MPETESTQDQGKVDAVVRAHKWYRESRDFSSEWRNNAQDWFAMVSGEQWEADTLMKLQDQQRPAVTFNRILRTINAVVGTQVANRQETRFLPRELGDIQTNEILSSAAEWVRDGCDAEDEESDSFRDMCIVGMGWTETRLDYQDDPEGQICIDRIDPLEMYWDPGARKRNLSDARWIMHVRTMSLQEFEDRWPDADPDSAQSPWEGLEDDTSKRLHVYPQDAYLNDQANKKGGRGLPRVRVAHLQWSESRDAYRVGKKAERMGKAGFEKLRSKLDQHKIDYMKQSEVVWKRAFIAGGEVMEEGPCPYPDGPTLRCMTHERNRNEGTWFGLVKAMVDPQRFGNKFFSQVLDIFNKGSKGGIMVEADAVEDFRALEEKWARPDAVLKVNPGALSQQKIQPKPLVTLPPGMDRLMSFSLDSVHEVNGISLEFLGAADRNQPGILEHQRKQAGLTILQPLFDAMRRYRKEQGRVLLYFIQEYISDGRLIRIMGKNGNEEYVPLAKQSDTAKYDVIVDEAPTSPNMKERVYGSLVEMLPALGKMGIPLPPELLDYAPIPSSLAQKWKEQIEQGQQLPPEVQKEMQRLAEENKQLSDKRQEAMADHQLDQQKAQAKDGLDKQAIALKREEAEAEHQRKLEEMRRMADLKRAQSEFDAEIKEEEVRNEIKLDRWKTEQQLEIQATKTEGELEIKRAQVANEKPEMTRRITVKRDVDGFIESADIEDILADVQGTA